MNAHLMTPKERECAVEVLDGIVKTLTDFTSEIQRRRNEFAETAEWAHWLDSAKAFISMAHVYAAEDEAESLRAQNAQLLAALKQYADPMNWGYHDEGGCPKGAGQYEDACFLGREVAVAAIAAAEAESEGQ